MSPNQPKTPVRAIRFEDETWDEVDAEAKERTAAGGEGKVTASDVVREAVREHLEARREHLDRQR